MGATVADLHNVGRGIPDLLVGFEGKNYLVEIKNGKQKLNSTQVDWHANWKGQVAIITNTNEAETLLLGGKPSKQLEIPELETDYLAFQAQAATSQNKTEKNKRAWPYGLYRKRKVKKHDKF